MVDLVKMEAVIAADRLVEEIACHVESADFLDMMGTLARKKRAREDAELRKAARLELKKEIARFIRSYKSENGNSIASTLAQIKARELTAGDDHLLVDAWPLAWLGLCDITMSMKLNQNVVPPQAAFKITLTEKGEERLRAEQAAAAMGEEPRT